MKTVLVVGRDWQFRALVRAQLREEGFEALGFDSLNDAQEETTGAAPPALVVIDTTETSPEEKQQMAELAERLPVLVVAAAQESLGNARLQVLRRPGAVSTVVKEAERIVASPANPSPPS
ncbi:MAG: hypothetical protein ACRD35_01585 [Candidatus Acidiferrales bacterium]